MITYLYITLIVIFIIDIARFPDSLKSGLSKLLNFKVVHLKPLDCSLCLTFWSTLIYTFLTHLTFFNIFLCCVCAWSTTYMLELIYTLQDLLIKILRKLQ